MPHPVSQASTKHSSMDWTGGHPPNSAGQESSRAGATFAHSRGHFLSKSARSAAAGQQPSSGGALLPIKIPQHLLREPTGLKIRIPRDLPNLPDAFRRRGAIRSLTPGTSSASAPGGPKFKRTHSEMMSEDAGAEHRGYSTTDPEKRVKIAKAVPPNLGPLPSHLANARNLAVRTTYSPGSSQTSTNSKVGFNGAHGSNKTATQSVTMTSVGEPERAGTAAVPNPVQSHRNKSKSKSSSPIPTPVQVASPAPLSSDPSSVLPTSTLSSVSNGVTHQLHMSGGRAMDSSALASIGDFSTRIPGDSGSLPLAGSTLASTTSTSMPASKTDGIDRLSILEIFRVGMSILDALTSNPVCKSFINKVPLSFSHYYDTIKKPMDLTTIEHKLWKTVALYNQAITAGTATVQVPSISPLLLSVSETLANGVTEGYADLQQFEKDLRRIYLNATKFNASTHVIFKEAQAFQTLYTNLLETSKQDRLVMSTPLPQELYRPELISMAEPGSLYLFRAHTFREMDRKMTDISTDLYAILHQPLLDTTSEIGQLSPENPRFLRMYINKNRSVLSKCRDERFARVVILSDVQLGRPFSAPISTANTPNPGEATGAGRGNGKTGPGTGMISMVRMSARILIGKPIGERHEMVTVGDLDCPNAWMTVVCVKSVEIDMEVPAKFEKGILSKMRHEVVPYSSENKIAPEYQRAFADALGVLLPNSKKIGQAHGAIGQRAAIPAVAAAIATSTSASTPSAVSSPIINKGLGISTSTPSSPALTVSTPESTTSPPAQQKSATAGPPKTRTKSGMTEIIDQGPNKSLIVKIRLPVLKTITTPKVDESQVTTPSHDRPLPQEVEMTTAADTTAVETTAAETVAVDTTTAETTAVETTAEETTATETTEMMTMTTTEETPQEPTIISTETTLSEPPQLQHPPTDSNPTLTATQHAASTPVTPLMHSGATAGVPHSTAPKQHLLSSQILATPSWSTTAPSTTADGPETLSAPDRMMMSEQMTKRGLRMLEDLKVVAQERDVPYIRWNEIEPTLTVDTAHGLFKRIYHVRGDDSIVIQNFKEMDAESFEMRVREVACLLKLRGLEGVGQIQAVIDNEEDHLVGLSMTKYAHTLKAYATNARKHPSPLQKLYLIRDMVTAMHSIHNAGLAHRDLSEVNIMVDEDASEKLEDGTPRPRVRVIDFGKSVFVERAAVEQWSMQEKVPEEELELLPLVVLPPDHGYKLYRSILTLPKTKSDHIPLAPVDPRSEDVYSLGVLIWRTFSGKSPWNGAIEDDLKTIRYLVSSDAQIQFQLEKEVTGERSRDLLLRCLTARAETRSTTAQLKEWLDQPQVASELLKEFEELGGGRKKTRKNLD